MSGLYTGPHEPSTRDRSHLSLAGSTSLSTFSRTLPISKSNYTVTANGVATYSKTYKSQPIHTSSIAHHRHKPHHPSKDSQNMQTKSGSNKIASHSNSQLNNTRSSQRNLLFSSPQSIYDSSSSPSPFSSTLTSSSDFSFPTTYSSSLHTPTPPSPVHMLHKQPKKDPLSAPYSSIPQVVPGQLRPTVCGPQSVDPAMTMVLERANVYIAASDTGTSGVGASGSGSSDNGSGGSVNTLNTSGSGSQLANMGASTGIAMSNYGSRFSKGTHHGAGTGNSGPGVGHVGYNPRALAIPASLLDKATRTNQSDTLTSNAHRRDGYTTSTGTGTGMGLDSLDALVTPTYSLSRPQSSAAGIGAGLGVGMGMGMGMGMETRQWPSFPVPQAPPLPRHASSSSAVAHGGSSVGDAVEAMVNVPAASVLGSVAVSRANTATATTAASALTSTSVSASTTASVAGSRVATAYGRGRDYDSTMSTDSGTGTGAAVSSSATSSSGHAVVITVAPPAPARSQRHAATRASHHSKHVANVAMALNALHPVLAGEQVDLLVQQYGQDEHGVSAGTGTGTGTGTAQSTSMYPMSGTHLPHSFSHTPTHGGCATSQDMHTLSEFLNRTRSHIPDVLPPNSLLQLSARNTQAHTHTRTRAELRAGGSVSDSARVLESTSSPDTLVNPKDQLVVVRSGAVRSEDVETFAFLAAQGLYMPSVDASGAAMVPRLHTRAHTHSRTQALRQGQSRAEVNGVGMGTGTGAGAGMGVSVPRVVAPIGLSGAALALALGPSNLTSVLKQSKARNRVRVDISFTLVCVHVPLACGILREGGPRAAYHLYQHACKLGQDSGVATSLLLASTVLGNESTEQHSRFRTSRILASAYSATTASTHHTPWWHTYQLSSLVHHVDSAADQHVFTSMSVVENDGDVKNALESRKTSVSDGARIPENAANMVHLPDSEKDIVPDSENNDVSRVEGISDADNNLENGISEADIQDNNPIPDATNPPEATSALDNTDIPVSTSASPGPAVDSLPLLSLTTSRGYADTAEAQAEAGTDIAVTAVGAPSPGSSSAHATEAPTTEPWMVPLPASPSFLASRSAHASRRASLAAQTHADTPHTRAHTNSHADTITATANGVEVANSVSGGDSTGVSAASGAGALSRRASLARRVSFAPLPTPTPSHPTTDAGTGTGTGTDVDVAAATATDMAADGVVDNVGVVETPLQTQTHAEAEAEAEAEVEALAEAAAETKSEEKNEGKANEEAETKAKTTEGVETAPEAGALGGLPEEPRAVDMAEEGNDAQPLPPPPSPPSTPPQNPEFSADPENVPVREHSTQESAVGQENAPAQENADQQSDSERENATVQEKENATPESVADQEKASVHENLAPESDAGHVSTTAVDSHERPTTASTTDTETTAATTPTQHTPTTLEAATTRSVDGPVTPRSGQGSAGARLKWLLSCEGDETEHDEEVDVVSVASQPMYVHSTEEHVVVVLQFTIVDQDTGERFTYTPKDIGHWRAQFQEQVQRDMAKSALLTQDLGSALTAQTNKAVSREVPQLQTQQPSLRSSKHLRVPLQMVHRPTAPSIVRLLHLETGTITIVPSAPSNDVDGGAVY